MFLDESVFGRKCFWMSFFFSHLDESVPNLSHDNQRSQTCTFEGLGLQSPPQFNEKTPREGRKERIFRREREKKSEILGGPGEGRPWGRAALGKGFSWVSLGGGGGGCLRWGSPVGVSGHPPPSGPPPLSFSLKKEKKNKKKKKKRKKKKKPWV